MKLKQRIKFSGRNLNEVFSLECVKAIIKDDEQDPVLIMRPEKMRNDCLTHVVFIGDFIEEYDNGIWNVLRCKMNYLLA